MTGSTIYAAQKTREAVNCLSLSDKGLRERLYNAASAMHALRADEIPDTALQEIAISIMSAVLDGETPDNIKLDHMSDDDVAKNARHIVELFEKCLVLYTKKPGGIDNQ
jgi:hypothetical protein